MANYNSWTRTNYFRIKDESKWDEFFRKLQEGSDDITDFSKDGGDGNRLHSFGGTGYIGFELTPEGIEPDVQYTDELKEMVADDDAVMILSIGHEKLNYVAAGSCIITSKNILYDDLSKIAVRKRYGINEKPRTCEECPLFMATDQEDDEPYCKETGEWVIPSEVTDHQASLVAWA